MKNVVLFLLATTGGMLGVAVYVIASSMIASAPLSLPAVVMSILVYGGGFGFAFIVLHRFGELKPSFGTCLGASFLSFWLTGAATLALTGSDMVITNVASTPAATIAAVTALISSVWLCASLLVRLRFT